ncbi:MAG: hypothetical protein JSR26_05515 [Proteobacteria bacterium]|nr:hypothetical protein [Pseudomonadota bacterium]
MTKRMHRPLKMPRALHAIVHRLRHHDWFTVIVEVLIVFVGVYFGLQVSNWNQERQDTARGRDYLQRFHVELGKEAALLDNMIDFGGHVGGYGAVAIAYAENGTLYQNSPWKTLLAYYQASQIQPFRQPGTTFDELRSSGELRLIRDAGLRARISEHYDQGSASHALEVLGVVPAYREHVRGMTPWPIQQYIWNSCYRMDNGVTQHLLDCPPPVGESEALTIIDAYRANAVLTEQLRFWMATQSTGVMIMRSIKTDAQSIDADVQKALAHP